MPSLLAVSSVHNHLLRCGLRTQAGPDRGMRRRDHRARFRHAGGLFRIRHLSLSCSRYDRFAGRAQRACARCRNRHRELQCRHPLWASFRSCRRWVSRPCRATTPHRSSKRSVLRANSSMRTSPARSAALAVFRSMICSMNATCTTLRRSNNARLPRLISFLHQVLPSGVPAAKNT